MLSILASGQIIKPPKTGKSANGQPWTSGLIRCHVVAAKDSEPDSELVSVIAFG